MKERPIIFSSEMVKAILLDGRKTRRKIYVSKKEDPGSQKHLVHRLANALDSAPAMGCWNWTRTKSQGYGRLTVSGKTMLAHRLAYILGHGEEIPIGMNVCHSCDNSSCINPAHLFLGTRSDNMKDCTYKGRSKLRPVHFPGENNPAHKLTAAKVSEIRTLTGKTQLSIAKRYGISQSQVSNIRRGLRWK